MQKKNYHIQITGKKNPSFGDKVKASRQTVGICSMQVDLSQKGSEPAVNHFKLV